MLSFSWPLTVSYFFFCVGNILLICHHLFQSEKYLIYLNNCLLYTFNLFTIAYYILPQRTAAKRKDNRQVILLLRKRVHFKGFFKEFYDMVPTILTIFSAANIFMSRPINHYSLRVFYHHLAS